MIIDIISVIMRQSGNGYSRLNTSSATMFLQALFLSKVFFAIWKIVSYEYYVF